MFNKLLRIEGWNALKRLFYGKRGEPYEIGGHVLRFIPGTRPTRTKYATSSNGVNRYDALQFLYMAEHLKPGMRCLDVGAHNGQDSLIMSALCGADGHVTGFEPNAEAREILWQNVALNPGVKQPKIVSAAVSDNDGRAMLYAEGGASSNSSLDPAGSTKDAVGQYEVDVVSLDRWITAMPDLVKIDIEGVGRSDAPLGEQCRDPLRTPPLCLGSPRRQRSGIEGSRGEIRAPHPLSGPDRRSRRDSPHGAGLRRDALGAGLT
jgi:FkbM family methyltransferase